MHTIRSLVDEGARRDFLKGFYAVAAVLAIFGVGLEFGAATAGSSVDWPFIAILGFSGVATGGALWQLLAAE